MRFPFRQFLLLHGILAGLRPLLRRMLRNPLPLVFSNWRHWSRFRRHFVQNVVIGILIEVSLLTLAALHFPLVTQFKNTALEIAMNWGADRPSSNPDTPHQLFIDIDEETYRDNWWGGGEPRVIPRARVAELAKKTFEGGINTVLLDFTVGAVSEQSGSPLDKLLREEDEQFKSQIEASLHGHPERHLLYVKTFRSPLDSSALVVQESRPSVLDGLVAIYPKQIHPVAPNFLVSPEDGLVRFWRLWESACQVQAPEKNHAGRWVVIPSPQIVLKALQQNRENPDLPPWGLDTQAFTAPCAVDGALSGTQDDGENSARADFMAGRWVLGKFGKCYEQDQFTHDQCAKDYRFAKDTSVSETAKRPRGEALGNRILYAHSDTKQESVQAGKHAKASSPYLLRPSALSIVAHGLPSETASHTPIIAIIGASYAESGDWHQTPLGAMPGTLVLVNAIDTMQTIGLVQSPNPWLKLGSIALVLLLVSAMFAALPYFWAATTLFIALALTMIPFGAWLVREQGIWWDYALPMLGIYVHMQVERVHEAMHDARQHL